jgi:hypothetical protein
LNQWLFPVLYFLKNKCWKMFELWENHYLLIIYIHILKFGNFMLWHSKKGIAVSCPALLGCRCLHIREAPPHRTLIHPSPHLIREARMHSFLQILPWDVANRASYFTRVIFSILASYSCKKKHHGRMTNCFRLCECPLTSPPDSETTFEHY